MLQLTPRHKEGPGHPATMELIHLPMPEEKVVVLKNDPDIFLSDSTRLSKRVFVHFFFCSRRRGEDRHRRACNDLLVRRSACCD